MAIFVQIRTTSANPSWFPQTAQTATATTSPALFQALTATTTVVTYDSFYQNSTGVTTKAASAALLLQLSATSTVQFNIAVQYSPGLAGTDCIATPLACDWYDDNLAINSTSYPYPVISFGNVKVFSVSNASSTKMVSLETPTRYVRVQAKVSGGPGSVWAQVVPNKERSE